MPETQPNPTSTTVSNATRILLDEKYSKVEWRYIRTTEQRLSLDRVGDRRMQLQTERSIIVSKSERGKFVVGVVSKSNRVGSRQASRQADSTRRINDKQPKMHEFVVQ